MNLSGLRRRKKLVLFSVSIAFGGATFLALDWLYSAAVRVPHRQIASQAAWVGSSPALCRVQDPVRQHAFQPNCAAMNTWRSEPYEVSTNNLGFRDERIRQVPLGDAKPRILALGDSMTEGMGPWRDTIVARIAAHFPQYDFLNGGVTSYSPSNYFNVARITLSAGVEIDEVIVFIDISDTQDEAAFYRDVGASGAVTGPAQESDVPWPSQFRLRIKRYLILTNYIVEFFERNLVRLGYYHISTPQGDIFDMERSAWTYRKVADGRPHPLGYAPLGVEGGIAKEKAKMTLLWQELARRHIPISVVVYPWPAQVAHDTPDSRHVRIWRDWCGGKCKRFISLFPAFQAVKDQCPRSQPGCWYLSHFIFGDMHFNTVGNALVAGEVIKSFEAALPEKVRLDSHLPLDPKGPNVTGASSR